MMRQKYIAVIAGAIVAMSTSTFVSSTQAGELRQVLAQIGFQFRRVQLLARPDGCGLVQIDVHDYRYVTSSACGKWALQLKTSSVIRSRVKTNSVSAAL